MKKTDCVGYNENTETEKTAIGSANGEIIYKETEITVSEYCSLFKKVDDFDCEFCKYYKSRIVSSDG